VGGGDQVWLDRLGRLGAELEGGMEAGMEGG